MKRHLHPTMINRYNGFTLIEVMVVVIIIGLMTTFLVVNLSSDLDRLARLESSRFVAVINEVRDEAIIAGENFLLSVDEKSNNYSFQATREDRSVSSDDGLLKARFIEPELRIKWQVFDDFDDQESRSRVLISPLGEITPFEISFIGEENEYQIFVNDDNQLEVRDVARR